MRLVTASGARSWPATISLALAAFSALVGEDARPGSVQLSDGTAFSGAVALIPGGSLQLHDGKKVKSIDFARVRELRLLPGQEHLEKNFRMPEAGKAFREEVGEPYPVRELAAQIELLDGSTITGHLGTTALTVDITAADAKPDDPPQRRKVILPAKQQGKPGEGFAVLVYPQRIRFSDGGGAAAAPTRLHLASGDVESLAVLSRDGLAVLDSQRTGPGLFTFESPLGAAVFLAVRAKLRIAVGWPAPGDPALSGVIAQGVKDASDFFDDRVLLGAWRPEGASDAFALVRLYRRGEAVDSPERPWHVEIWRFHLGDDGKVMLAGRGNLFRGVTANDQGLPTVTLSPALWSAHERDGEWLVEGSVP